MRYHPAELRRSTVQSRSSNPSKNALSLWSMCHTLPGSGGRGVRGRERERQSIRIRGVRTIAPTMGLLLVARKLSDGWHIKIFFVWPHIGSILQPGGWPRQGYSTRASNGASDAATAGNRPAAWPPHRCTRTLPPPSPWVVSPGQS